MHDRAFIAALIEATAGAGDAEALASRSWPGGVADRSRPAALEWVRRWGPSRLTAAPLECSCDGGRCAICN